MVKLFRTLIAVVSARYCTATLMRDSHLRHLCCRTKFVGAAACASTECSGGRKPSQGGRPVAVADVL